MQLRKFNPSRLAIEPMFRSLSRLLWLTMCFFAVHAVAGAEPSPLMLANVYRADVALDDYWVSEKFDGVRGYWNGHALFTRGGERIHAPAWFVKDWPASPLDGELWAGRGRFQEAVSTVRQQTPDDAAWRRMKFMVFDLPAQPGDFNQRLPVLQALLSRMNIAWVQAVNQSRVSDHETLQVMLDRIVAEGGEGLMLHRGASLYRAVRSNDLLKFKPYEDSDARVIAHLPGKGKYTGMTGALLVETAEGVRFRLGSGLTDEQRRQPPPVGSLLTYRFRGYHDSGIPRFAVFMRVRDEW